MSTITVRIHDEIGPFKSLHGVNNGPITYGSLVDVSDYYKAMNVPLVRLHDPNWPHPREVDIHIIFPDFDKDPSDPASYNFSQTDDYMRTVAATGAKIVYRLGESIEHTERKYFVHPPRDYEKWAQICIGIIKHYNQGWADGFYYGIEYWEIWNEPDYSVRMWSGTHEQYYKLYEVASAAIKAFDPSLKVGGPAAAGPTRDFVPEFLEYSSVRSLPLDFFSWHTYTADPQKIVKHANHVREMLNRYGYTATESHLNEWNYFLGDFRTIWNKGNEYIRKDVFDRQKGGEGASFSAHVLTLLQDLPVDHANYYDGQPTALFCGLFDYHGVPQKTYYAFQAYANVISHRTRISCSAQPVQDGLSCIAGKDADTRISLLLTHFRPEDTKVTVYFDGLSGDAHSYRIHSVDENHCLEPVEEGVITNMNGIELLLPKYCVLYVSVV